MNWQMLFEPENSSRICLTLVHSLWQVALAAVVASVISRAWRKISVEWNYVLYVTAFVVSLSAAPITFLVLSPGSAVETKAVAVTAAEKTASPATPGEIAAAPIGKSAWAEPMAALRDAGADGRPSNTESSAEVEHVAQWQRFAPWLAGLYATGAALMLLRLGIGVVRAEQMRRDACPLESGPVAAALTKLAQHWKMHAAPMLAQGERIVVPTVVGLVRPMILLPASALTGLATNELELILAHELAHIRRCDMWVNLLQRLGEVVLFFNPALWYLSRRIATLREYCCDELVCRQQSGAIAAARAEYATALVHVVELAKPTLAGGRNLAALAASGGSPSELRRRVARLFGEPLGEPIRLSRGGLLAAAALTLAIFVGPGWLRTQAETTADQAGAATTDYPPPATEADRIVAEARAKTFGLQGVPKISFRQTYWNGDVTSMTKESEQSLKLMWEARGKAVDEKMRRITTSEETLAWDGPQLLVQEATKTEAAGSVPAYSFTQSRFWDGNEGWLGESSPHGRNIYRYRKLGEIMKQVMGFYYPQWATAGGRLPWSGPEVVLDEYEVDPKLTRYHHEGTATIDGVECDIYDGPARQERLWIEKPTGLVKAMCKYYVFTEVPNYYTEQVRDVAGRTFKDSNEYGQWIKQQPADVQAKVSAHWGATNFNIAEPGNLSVFSDYREITPGVRWPMMCERITTHPNGNKESKGYRFIRGESAVKDVTTEFSMRELAKAALPQVGNAVTDRRFDPPVDYKWKDSTNADEIEALAKQKLDEQHAKEAKEEEINETPINSVADAMHILTDGPKVEPNKVWARAIKYLVDHKEEAFPVVIQQLDAETRDHPISKLAFTLRAMGDWRAVPALIRALPKTLQPSRSDYGLILKDAELLAFIQQHDQDGKIRGGEYFDYGRAFREVASALHKLTGKNFGEMELNWVYLSDSPPRREQQEAQFHKVAKRWEKWWDANWKTMVDDPAYSKVNLPALAVGEVTVAGRTQPPSGLGVKLNSEGEGTVLQSAQESKHGCFMDLDTMREGGWPASLGPVDKIGVDSPEVRAWARKEGFDVVCVTATPPGESKPLYCLQPLDMHVWKITPAEHKSLAEAMAGRQAYPLSRPVELMVPQREVKPPYDYKYGGDSFLFITREGTTGVIRITAQVTDTDVITGVPYNADDQFSHTAFNRGAKMNIESITEPQAGNSKPK